MIVRITAQDSAEPYDVLMTRPLLVTRVMRSLDEAHVLLGKNLGGADDTSDAKPEKEAVAAAPDTEAAASVETVVSSSEVESPLESESGPVAVTGGSDSSPEPESSQAVEVTEPAETEASPSQANESVKAKTQKPAQTVSSEDSEVHYRALVVDDSAAIRKQLELELRDAGISADFAEDGEQAMEKVAANRYDLIFLDIIMPGIDGYEACKRIRARAELKKTPIIMLSAKTSPLDEVQGVIAGASTYLTKPVKSEQLQSTLKRVSMWIDNFQEA